MEYVCCRLPQANNTPIIVDALTLPHKLINNALPSYHAQHHTNLLHPTVKYTPTKLTTPAQYIPTLTPNKATTTVAIHQLRMFAINTRTHCNI